MVESEDWYISQLKLGFIYYCESSFINALSK